METYIMTKAAAIYQFWSGFGLPAYEENSVYGFEEAPDFPYITYELNTDAFSENAVSLSGSLWYRSTSWIQCNAKAEEISKTIGQSGILLKCDGGYIWIRRSSPFAQSMGDDSDDIIKRKYINISAEFFAVD